MPRKSSPYYFELTDFSLGLDWSSAPDSIDPRSLYDAKNVNLTTNRTIEKRGGMDLLYADAYSANSVMNIFEYPAPNGTKYVLVACGTKIGYYDSSWTDVKTGLTADQKYSMSVHQGYCFVVNGTDSNFKIRNTTTSNVGITPPAAKPTVADASGSGLTGSFKYVYAYKRDTEELISNYSAVSDTVTITDSSINVTYAESSDAQVDNIVIYRTLDLLDEDNSSTVYYKVTEVTNGNGTYEDSTADADLTTLATNTQTVPPKAKFIKLHKDRMFYANCPDETDGTSLFMFSKAGQAEACPSTNYHYFDRADGESITGHASIGDYYVVFKRNKIAVMEGNFEEWYTVSNRIGCISAGTILEFKDFCVFLSEEGWKIFDGANIYDASRQLKALTRANYFDPDEADNYQAAYYPDKEQMHFLLNHSSYTKIVMVGHWLAPLFERIPVENISNPDVGWTYHQYDNHTLTTLGTCRSGGLTILVAGSSDGKVYQLDTGFDDENNDIAIAFETGWLPLTENRSLTKTLRVINVTYAASAAGTVSLIVDIDHTRDVGTYTLTSGGGAYTGYAFCNAAYCGVYSTSNENQNAAGTGRLFRFRVTDTSDNTFMLMSVGGNFKVHGVRAS